MINIVYKKKLSLIFFVTDALHQPATYLKRDSYRRHNMASKMNFYLPSSANQMITITKYEADKISESMQAIKHLLNNRTVDVLIKKINPLVFDIGDFNSKKIYSFNHTTFKWMVHKEEDYEDEIRWNWQKQYSSF